ncbi:MAG: HAD family hydrolase [Candidatus Wallbacteria bacterium]|nr:HAD family hydrolase [Candidatus Wallbacteria bacterium]
MVKLILFDIDGTLVLSGGAGARALARAFSELYEVSEAMTGIVFAGCTDPMIVRDIFRVKLGREDRPGELQRVLDRYLLHLPEEVGRAEKAAVLPGVEALLAALSPRADVLIGLLTGNIEPGARIKLGRFGLDGYFGFGGFASDSEDRDEIARVALARGRQRAGRDVPAEDAIVVGDTPRDISCGRAIGARVLAVATGPHPKTDLAAHAPDWLLQDLSGTTAVMELLLDGEAARSRWP